MQVLLGRGSDGGLGKCKVLDVQLAGFLHGAQHLHGSAQSVHGRLRPQVVEKRRHGLQLRRHVPNVQVAQVKPHGVTVVQRALYRHMGTQNSAA